MVWLQLTVFADPEQAEQVADILQELGAGAVTMNDAAGEELFEPLPGEIPLWSLTRVTGLFGEGTDIEDVLENLTHRLGFKESPHFELSEIEDQDWERAWLSDFKPLQFGTRLWIVPTVYDPIDSNAVNIRLDPGLAFGTGTHQTTALCLEWLDRHDVRDQTVIDFGCGSGVLGIAAAMLGARHVWAVDIDPQAVIATKDNAQLNKVANLLTVTLSTECKLPSVDILLANILANPLQSLAEEFATLVKSGGKIVLSGILREQESAVMDVYQKWFDMDAPQHRDDWVMLAGTRKRD